MYSIYGRTNCIWCDRAKELLDQKGLQWEFYNIETDKKALSEFKFIFDGATTVPKILVGLYDEVKVIGGYKELYDWLKHSTNKS